MPTEEAVTNHVTDPAPRKSATVYCEPCKYGGGGNCVLAVGYCTQCAVYLCQSCFDDHPLKEKTKEHVLLDQSKMPRAGKAAVADKFCTDMCEEHTGEVIKYFCASHGDLGCSMCTTLNHRTCKLDYIPDIAENYKESEEYKALVRYVEKLADTVKQFEDQVNGNTEETATTNTAALQDIRTFRKEINAYLDTRETELLAKTEQQKVDDKNLLNNVKKHCQKLGKDIRKLQLQLESEELVKLFSMAKRSQAEIRRLYMECSSLRKQPQVRNYHFKPAVEIRRLINNKTSLGGLVFDDAVPIKLAAGMPRRIFNLGPNTDVASMKLVKISQIDIRQAGVDAVCVRGISMLTTDTVLLSYWNDDNNLLQLQNTKTKKISSSLVLPSAPWCVACLPDDQAAVTIPRDQKILIVSTKGELSNVREISVKGRCMGITYTDKNLVVTYQRPAKVEILSMTGEVLNTVTKDKRGDKLFMWPNYVTTQQTEHGKFMYVSDEGTDTTCIIKISMLNLKVDCRYIRPGLSPRGIIALGGGQLAVCSKGGSNIRLISDNGVKMTALDQWKCCESPRALVLSPMRDMLCVSSGSNTDADNFLHVYKLTYDY